MVWKGFARMKTELIKLRCSSEEKELLMILCKAISEKRQENVSHSEVMRIALWELAVKEFGIEKVTRLLSEPKPV